MLSLNKISPAALSDTIKVAPVAQPLVPVSAEELERAKTIGDLKQLKELLDAKIITDAEVLTLKKKYQVQTYDN